MHDEIDAVIRSTGKNLFEQVEKILSSSSPLHSGPDGVIQSQVGIGDQEQADGFQRMIQRIKPSFEVGGAVLK